MGLERIPSRSGRPDNLVAEGANRALELIGTARAIRSFLADPVDPDLLRTIVWAATRASSPNNSQPWHFVVVTDRDRRVAVAAAIRRFRRWVSRLEPAPDDDTDRLRRQANSLLDHLDEVPAMIFVCARNDYPEGAPDPRYMWTSIGTATQNLLLAAHSVGLGATPTMFHVIDEEAVSAVIGLPSDVVIGFLVVLGWPAATPGQLRRKKLDEVLHLEHW